MGSVCKIDADGRLTLPAEIAESFREKAVRYAILVQTWDGYRLEPIADEDGERMLAEEADPVTVALRAVGAVSPE